MISSILLVLGCGVLAAALRSFRQPVLFTLGTLGMVATSFLAGWILGGSLVLGTVFALSWFLLPWVEILTRVRKLRLPIDRQLEACTPPARSEFPDFSELSEEIESAGFEYCEDVRWQHEGIRQFYRFYYRAESRTAGTICLIEQGPIAFYYVAMSSRTADGQVFLTWNYPFSYGLHLPPKFSVNRASGDLSVSGLAAAHSAFLEKAAVGVEGLLPRTAENIRMDVQSELREQLDHNLNCGLLKRDGGEMIRYSARGMFFLWLEFLRDFVRIS